MRIGELARHTGISERMLRHYEQESLLRPARTDSGYRDYGEAEIPKLPTFDARQYPEVHGKLEPGIWD